MATASRKCCESPFRHTRPRHSLLLALRAQAVDLQGVRLGDVPGLFGYLAGPFLHSGAGHLARAGALRHTR